MSEREEAKSRRSEVHLGVDGSTGEYLPGPDNGAKLPTDPAEFSLDADTIKEQEARAGEQSAGKDIEQTATGAEQSDDATTDMPIIDGRLGPKED